MPTELLHMWLRVLFRSHGIQGTYPDGHVQGRQVRPTALFPSPVQGLAMYCPSGQGWQARHFSARGYEVVPLQPTAMYAPLGQVLSLAHWVHVYVDSVSLPVQPAE